MLFTVISHAESLSSIADAIVADEIKHRVEIRRLQRAREIAELNSTIEKLDSSSQSGSIDIGMDANSAIGIPSTGEDFSSAPAPTIIGYRNNKGVFKQGKQLKLAGKNDVLPGGYKVLQVTADSALLKMPSGGTIEQAISWNISSTENVGHE